jgi:hypothetical protein
LVAVSVAGESAAVASARRGWRLADVVVVAAVLLGCAWIGGAGARSRAYPGVTEHPTRTHEVRRLRREHILVEIIRHFRLYISLLLTMCSEGEAEN